MAKICEITGKRPRVGNNVSHAKNKTKRWFYPNLQMKKFFLAEEDMWVTLKVSTSVLRTINKKGISTVLKEAKGRGSLAAGLGYLVADKYKKKG
jgi:large subunit ribosomal protein L28